MRRRRMFVSAYWDSWGFKIGTGVNIRKPYWYFHIGPFYGEIGEFE